MKVIQACGYKNCVSEGIILKYEMNFLSLMSLAFSFSWLNVVKHFYQLECQKKKEKILKVHSLTAMTFFFCEQQNHNKKNTEGCSEMKCNSKGFSQTLGGLYYPTFGGDFK